MNAFALSGLLTTVSSLAIGVFVLWVNPRRPLNQVWCLFTVTIAGWGLTSLAVGLATDPMTTLWIWRIGFAIGVVWIPICLYHFITILCGLDRATQIRRHYATGALMVPIILCSPLFIHGVRPIFGMQWIIPGPLYVMWTLWWFGFMLHGHYQIFIASRRARGLKRNQYRYILIGIGLTSFTGALCFLPTYGIELYPYGNFGICIYPFVIAFAIVKHRTLGITIVVERSLAFLLLSLMSIIPALLISVAAQESFFGHIRPTFSLLIFGLFSLLIVGAYHIRQAAERTIAHNLFPERQERYASLLTFSKTLASLQALTPLTHSIAARLMETFQPRTISVYVLTEDKTAYARMATAGPVRTTTCYAMSDILPHTLGTSQTILLRSHVEQREPSSARTELLKVFNEDDTDVTMPFFTRDELVGFCLLGARSDEEPYSEEEFQLLHLLAEQAAIGIHNALLYQTLKRTESLMQRTERQRSVHLLAAGFAHEIRNPLLSIDRFVELVIQHPHLSSHVLEMSSEVQDNLRHINRLVRDILQYAKHRTPEYRPTDLTALVSECVASVAHHRSAHAVTVITKFADDVPVVTVDPQQLKQVLLNLLMNALEAMQDHHGHHGTLTIRTYTESPHHEPWVCIDIADTGTGIDATTLPHIFDPFFTTKEHHSEHESSGLGLAIAKQILHDHDGLIDVTSMVNHGTTMTIQLPVHRPGVVKGAVSPNFQRKNALLLRANSLVEPHAKPSLST